jgi:hypothetical protein
VHQPGLWVNAKAVAAFALPALDKTPAFVRLLGDAAFESGLPFADVAEALRSSLAPWTRLDRAVGTPGPTEPMPDESLLAGLRFLLAHVITIARLGDPSLRSRNALLERQRRTGNAWSTTHPPGAPGTAARRTPRGPDLPVTLIPVIRARLVRAA